MYKKDFVNQLYEKQKKFTKVEVEQLVESMLQNIVSALNSNETIEIRGFGRFSTRLWGPRYARNPTTGESWMTNSVYALHFRPGKGLKDLINSFEDE